METPSFLLAKPVSVAERHPSQTDLDCEGQVWAWIDRQQVADGLPVVPGGWELRMLDDLDGATHWLPTGLRRPPAPSDQAADWKPGRFSLLAAIEESMPHMTPEDIEWFREHYESLPFARKFPAPQPS